MAFTFHKSERLCSKKLIAQLFVKGNRGFSRFPFRFTWVETTLDTQYPAQVLFIVSKRNFANATGRNKVKRQMRELYRHAKPHLYEVLQSHGKQIALSIAYMSPAHLSSQELSSLFTTGINQLCYEMAKHRPGSVHPADQNL
jgi:ribonuclease P protein component